MVLSLIKGWLKSGSLSTFLSPLHVNLHGVSDLFRLLVLGKTGTQYKADTKVGADGRREHCCPVQLSVQGWVSQHSLRTDLVGRHTMWPATAQKRRGHRHRPPACAGASGAIPLRLCIGVLEDVGNWAPAAQSSAEACAGAAALDGDTLPALAGQK